MTSKKLRVLNMASPTGAIDTTIPDSPEALADFLADDKRSAAVFADPDLRAQFLTAYNRITNRGDHLARQITDQVTNEVFEFLRESGATDRPNMEALADRMTSEVVSEIHRANLADQPISVYNPRAMGAVLDADYTNSADFFATIWHNADRNNPQVVSRQQAYRNAFSENVPSEGGFLVPERLRSELLRTALETAIVRPRARVVPMDSLRVPFPAIDGENHTASLFGGVVAYWTEEGATLTGTQPTFRRLVLDAKKLTAYTDVPNELIADSAISFQAFIDDIFPEALAWYEDLAFFEGGGVGEPLGFLNADAAVEVAKESGQAADTIVWENIVKAYARMLPSSLGRAVWVANIECFAQLALMSLDVGTGGSAIWVNNGAEGPPMTILGRPVLFTEKAEALGDAGDINFVDFGFYLIGDRQAMSARSSEHHKFQNDETSFRIIQRVDGRPWLNTAVTPKKGAGTLSPFVKVAERA